MADITFTTANTSGFIPQFWANRALDVLRNNIVLAKLVSADTAWGPGDFATQGQSLTIPYPGTFTAVDKAAGTPVTPQAPSGGASVSLTLSKHKVVPFLVEDFAAAQANLTLMDRYINPAVIALAEQFESDLFALYPGISGSLGTSGTSLTAATVQATRKAMTDAKVPLANRSLVISTKDEISLLSDSTIATYFAFSQTQAIKEGSIGRLYGFDIYTSQMVPVVAGTPNSTKNIALTDQTLLYATRPFREPPANSGVMTATSVDQVSGLSIRISAQYDINNVGMRVNLDMLYGMVNLRPGVGEVVLS